MNLYNKYVTKEEKIGNLFANNLLDSQYIKNNSKKITDIDGKINGNLIELQELNYQAAIDKRSVIVDVISAFYFRGNRRSSITLNDKDIDIKKFGKVFTLPKDSTYLIYFKSDQYYNPDYIFDVEGTKFIALKASELYRFFIQNNQRVLVNNKRKYNLSDTYESAFSFCDIDDLISYGVLMDRNQLQSLMRDQG